MSYLTLKLTIWGWPLSSESKALEGNHHISSQNPTVLSTGLHVKQDSSFRLEYTSDQAQNSFKNTDFSVPIQALWGTESGVESGHLHFQQGDSDYYRLSVHHTENYWNRHSKEIFFNEWVQIHSFMPLPVLSLGYTPEDVSSTATYSSWKAEPDSGTLSSQQQKQRPPQASSSALSISTPGSKITSEDSQPQKFRQQMQDKNIIETKALVPLWNQTTRSAFATIPPYFWGLTQKSNF